MEDDVHDACDCVDDDEMECERVTEAGVACSAAISVEGLDGDVRAAAGGAAMLVVALRERCDDGDVETGGAEE